MPLNFKRYFSEIRANKILILFLLLWFSFNVTQALISGLHADEAYYWLYSKFLEWGYFDHPPMVAVFIKASSFINNTLGVRLFTCISNLLSIYFLWLIVKEYNVRIWVFLTLFSSVLLFHVYGFITTPDVPLLFFSVLFLYGYQNYLKKDSWVNALILGLVVAALLYSKYHGILLLFFVLISNLKLFKRPTFYLLFFVAITAFLPHIIWQYQNGFPSLQYHLFDRSAEPYELNLTLKYLMDFLLVSGPLTGWILIYQAYKQKNDDDVFLRGLKFIFLGIFVFFFFSTLKGEVQAHWPLIGFIPMLILASINMTNQQTLESKRWMRIIFGLNLFLIIIVRILLMVPSKTLNNNYFISSFNGYDIWAKQISNYTKENPVIFLDGFQEPSLYNYYTQSTRAFDYDSYRYRKTQYEIFPLEDSIRNRKAYYLTSISHKNPLQDTIRTNKGIYYGLMLDNVRMYQKVSFVPENIPKQWNANETENIVFNVSNPYNEDISFDNIGKSSKCSLMYVVLKDGEVFDVKEITSDFNSLKISANSSKKLTLKISTPCQKGKYKVFISIKTEPFEGGRNSGMMSLNIK